MGRLWILVAASIAGCSSAVYVRDGVTDGDTFHLAPRAYGNPDPAAQAWTSYSLARSICQLGVGGDNPARASTFDCELKARRALLSTWVEQNGSADAYLDTLAAVGAAGFLEEYVHVYLGRESWQVPPDVDLDAFDAWRRLNLRGHRPETRLMGSWSYSRGGDVAASSATPQSVL
jgi:hypothetical protein